MYIKCWGARGSSPVSGKKFIKYGGNTSCLEIRAGDPEQVLLLDFGTGALPMGLKLTRENNKDLSVLLTHYHWDHIMGFPLFPLLFLPDSKLRFYFAPEHQDNPEKMVVKELMKPPHFPLGINEIPVRFNFYEVGSSFSIGSLRIKNIPLSHPNHGLGYRLEHNNKSLVFLTDNELGFRHPGAGSVEDYVHFCLGADLLIHDAEYFSPLEYEQVRGFGHSLVDHVIELAQMSGVKSLGLYHHNRERDDDQIDMLVARLNRESAEKYNFEIFALAQEQEIYL
jgi:ribonuclease BN (tRNA processing enzyme)